jgi:hypothetical protein
VREAPADVGSRLSRQRRRLAPLGEQLGGKALGLGDAFNLDGDGVDLLLQLVEALLELEGVRKLARRAFLSKSADEPYSDRGERCDHTYDDHRHYGEIGNFRIHDDLECEF